MGSRATIAILALLGVVLLAGGMLLVGWSARARAAVEATGGEADEAARPQADLAASPSAGARDSAAVPPAEPAPAAPAELADVEEAPQPAPGAPDLEARAPLSIRVVNAEGVGVADAEVRIWGMRSESDPGSWYGYRGAEPIGRTDTDGRLTLEHWVWVNVDGRTRSVDLNVRHPEYTPYRDSSFDVGPGEHEVELQRGSTIVVSAWIGDPARHVAPISAQVDVEAELGSGAWIVNADGSVQTSQLEPGPHLLRVRHESAEHGLCFSALASFTLGDNDWQAQHVELFPAERLAGELDPAVPRPVIDGRVQVCVRANGIGGAPSLYHEVEAPIAADGTFVVEGLPRGEAQLIALARGWSSKRVRPATFEQAGITRFDDPTPEETARMLGELDTDSFIPQVVPIPSVASPYVVPMEPTAAVEIRTVTSAGVPVEGVHAGINPNVCYDNVGCSIVPWREWTGKTDADGRLRIVDVPPDASIWASVHDERWLARMVGDERYVAVAARSGELTSVEIVLEPKP